MILQTRVNISVLSFYTGVLWTFFPFPMHVHKLIQCNCLSLCQEEGLKLTFSKQALMPNGSGGESSSRKRRKDQEVHVSGVAVYSSRTRVELHAKTQLFWIVSDRLSDLSVLVVRPRWTP